MFFRVLKRYPLLTRLTLMQGCLGTLCYSLFLSAELANRVNTGVPAVPNVLGGPPEGAIQLLQILLAALFAGGCLLTLRAARRSLMDRTDLALACSHAPNVGAALAGIRASDEVDRLAQALERTAATLSTRLAAETHNTEQARAQERFATATLDFIHRSSLSLTENNLNAASVAGLLEDMAQSLGAGSCTLALLEPVAESLAMPGVIAFPHAARLLEHHSPQELNRQNRHKRTLSGVDGDTIELAVPVRDAADTYGVLIVETRANFLFESRQSRVADTVAALIALSLGNLLRNQRRRRLALMDERNTIAGELHDSLAQTLAYMKIQVVRLQKELDRHCKRCTGGEDRQIHEIAAEIRTGLDSAYRHLRELLTAFRTNMPPGSLQQALREVVDELDARSGTDITLEYRLDNLALSVNEEFQLLQIVREALTNVVRHAHAQHASVCLETQDDGQVRVLVEDDGRGPDHEGRKEGHYGLSIMNERAQQLGGSFCLQPAQANGSGTRVRLLFKPRSQHP